MRGTRRMALRGLLASGALIVRAQEQQQPNERTLPIPPNPDKDTKLPNGKSQRDAIAKENHERALKDANDLVAVAQELRDELKKSGNYVVSVSSVKKTEEIERLAKRIRSRLKD